jgi:hypothetical protein
VDSNYVGKQTNEATNSLVQEFVVKLTVAQLTKKLTGIYSTWMLIIEFTKARHWSVSYTGMIDLLSALQILFLCDPFLA